MKTILQARFVRNQILILDSLVRPQNVAAGFHLGLEAPWYTLDSFGVVPVDEMDRIKSTLDTTHQIRGAKHIFES
jgi:hypothetical protein